MDISLSGDDIIKALDGEVNIVLYNQLSKMSTLHDLFQDHKVCCVLYLSRPNYGHWVCLVRDDTRKIIYYFDPYGECIDQPLSVLSQKTRRQCNEVKNFLSRIIYNSGYHVDYNDEPLQADSKSIATCGRWAITRGLFDELSNDQFASLFKHRKGESFTPDELVFELTHPLLGF